ncbi:MAG: hypothetical protein F4X08_04895 [Gemmatimonadetes bacterium]|nr:hypothetical protein [Gemmatimonadota bacterium]
MEKGWSINQAHWNDLDKVIPKSEAWTSVLLTPIEDIMVPETAGVYAICVRPPITTLTDSTSFFSSLSTPIYIGQSGISIKKRFLQHCQSPAPTLKLAKYCYGKVQLMFWFVPLSKEKVKTVETLLIRCFGPPVNQVSGTISGSIKNPISA